MSEWTLLGCGCVAGIAACCRAQSAGRFPAVETAELMDCLRHQLQSEEL